VQVYENIKAVVEAAGGTMANIVATTVIVTDNRDKAAHRRAQTLLSAALSVQHRPDRPVLSPGYLIEVNAVAILETNS